MHEMLHNLQTLLNRFNKKCSHKLPGLKVQGCSGRCTGISGDENWCAFLYIDKIFSSQQWNYKWQCSQA